MAAELTVLFALEREAGPFRRVNAGAARVVVTGVGARAAAAAAGRVLDGSPGLVVAAGFAGGLVPGLAAGRVVVATEVIDDRGGRWPAAPLDAPDATTGRVVTVAHIVAEPEDKRRLAERTGAVAADMESAAVAAACHARGVPFACVRAVSDDADTSLSPDVLELIAGGRSRPLAAAAAVLRRPRLLVELLRLARDTRRAADALAAALSAAATAAGSRTP